MSIAFTSDRWERIREDYAAWWAGDLKRPLIHMVIRGRDPERPAPPLPYRHFTASYDHAVPAEDIVDVWDYELSHYRFLGDAFPSVWPNFGPGVAAAFLGGGLDPQPDTVWFHPPPGIDELCDVRLEYQPDNIHLRRVKDICRAAVERWQGSVQVGMTDLGGILDILQTFRPGEALLMDLCEQPDLVKDLCWQCHDLWWRYFHEMAGVLQPANPGFTAWTPIFSSGPYYMLQCDFAYMIGPAMFDEFVKPELAASCGRLANAFYHLDGKGQLGHLDSLLSIPGLKGVQWIPGAGQPPCDEWPEVYRKIRGAGKLVQLWGDPATLDTVVRQIGSPEGIILITEVLPSQEQEARDFLRRYGARHDG